MEVINASNDSYTVELGFEVCVSDIEEFAECYKTTVTDLKQKLYEETECGARVEWDDRGITVWAPGSGDFIFTERFNYPVLISEVDKWLNDLDNLCCKTEDSDTSSEGMIEVYTGTTYQFKYDGHDFAVAVINGMADFYIDSRFQFGIPLNDELPEELMDLLIANYKRNNVTLN